jgi:hypothetical protein
VPVARICPGASQFKETASSPRNAVNYEIRISTEEMLPKEKQLGTVVGLEEATTIALDVGALACSKKSECKRQFWQESGACN